MVDSIRIISLNCWGLKYLADLRRERLSYIGSVLANADPIPDLVGLQECWAQEDYQAIRDQTRGILPYAKFYHSGVFGGGLALLSRWPIVESTMQRYTLNGRPTAFFRGDWYVGKGVACATIRLDGGELVDVYNTHLHAPYEREPNDSYICHRTAQAWEVSKLLRASRAKSRLALALGDFNMIPSSLAHQLITTHGPAIDTWKVLHPFSSVGSTLDQHEIARGVEKPTALYNITENGTTCDSIFNSWRWSDNHKKALKKGEHIEIDPGSDDPRAKRLDYIFLGGSVEGWKVSEANVGMVERHPDLRVSLSDHFSVEVTIDRPKSEIPTNERLRLADEFLPLETYDAILEMTEKYMDRERDQRQYRLGHLGFGVGMAIACWVAVWWSPRNFVSFILMLVSSLGLSAGVIDGLIGGLFMSWEIRSLKEFKWEMENLKQLSTIEYDDIVRYKK